MDIVESFINNLVKTLDENEEFKKSSYNSIPFIIAPLSQSLKKCNDFIEDLNDCNNNYSFNYRKSNNNEWYSYGFIDVIIQDKDYFYTIEIYLTPQLLGYCQCTKEYVGYREDKKCCGYECDWDAPTFSLTKTYYLYNAIWQGDQHDYWNFEDDFNNRYINKKEKVKPTRIYELNKIIEHYQDELNKLLGNNT